MIKIIIMTDSRPLKAVILADGKGSGLADETSIRPKSAVVTPAGSAERVMLPRDTEAISKIEAAFASMLAERAPVKPDAADGAFVIFNEESFSGLKFGL